MSSLTYTEPTAVSGIRITETPRSPYVSGYGAKIPSSAMIRYLGRWRRVYVMQYGNAGTAYVIVGGKDVLLDSITDEHLANLARLNGGGS